LSSRNTVHLYYHHSLEILISTTRTSLKECVVYYIQHNYCVPALNALSLLLELIKVQAWCSPKRINPCIDTHWLTNISNLHKQGIFRLHSLKPYGISNCIHETLQLPNVNLTTTIFSQLISKYTNFFLKKKRNVKKVWSKCMIRERN
jgi:hypothetical protein